jgi:hypothetical protein
MHISNNDVPLRKYLATTLHCGTPGKAPQFINYGSRWRRLVTSTLGYLFMRKQALLAANWIGCSWDRSVSLDTVTKMGLLSLLRQETLSPSRKQLQDPEGRHLILHFVKTSRSSYYHNYINIITIDIRVSIISIQFLSAKFIYPETTIS